MSDRTEEDRESHSSYRTEVLTVLYLWMINALFCGIAGFTRVPTAEASAFILESIVVFSAAALLVLTFPRLKAAIALLAIFLAAALPSLSALGRADTMMANLQLYFYLLLIAPALLRVWTWRLNLAAGVGLSGFWFFWHSAEVVSLLLLGAVVLLSAALSYFWYGRASVSRKAIECLEELQSRRVLSNIWTVAVLQIGMLVAFVFLELLTQLHTGSGADSNYISYYAWSLAVVVFGVLLLPVVKSYFRYWVLVGAMTAVALLLVSAPFAHDARWLYHYIPVCALVFLSLSTAAFPWPVAMQIAVSWLIAVVGTLYYTAASMWQVDILSGVLPLSPEVHKAEMFVLISAAVLSVFGARYMRQLRLISFFQLIIRSSDADSGGRLSGKYSENEQRELIVDSTENSASNQRARELVWGLAFLGLLMAIATAFLLKASSIPNVGSILYFSLWCVLFVGVRRQLHKEKVWILGALLGLLFLLWPNALVVLAGADHELWLLLPVCTLAALGFVPWTLRELLPLLGAGLVASVSVVVKLGLGALGTVLVILGMLVGIFLSLASTQRLKRHHLSTRYREALQECKNEKEALEVLADHLLTLFGAHSALISSDKKNLELLRDGMIYTLEPERWPLHELREQLGASSADEDSVKLRIMNWLPSRYAFFDQRFGVFSAENGLLLELNFTVDEALVHRMLAREMPKIASAEPVPQHLLVFIPFSYPVVPWLLRNELALMRTLSSETLLRLDAFQERYLRVMETKALSVIQSERDYELSSMVHDINNTVQDLALLCDGALENLDTLSADFRESKDEGSQVEGNLRSQISRIGVVARGMATVASDVKRKRELELLSDLEPREMVDVSSVLKDWLEYAQLRAERKRVEVLYAEKADAQVWVKVSSRDHLETIVRNLGDNAIRCSESGSDVRIVIRSSNEWVWIDVEDSGPGLSKEEIRSMFDMNRYAQKKKKSKGDVGLIQAKRFAESQGGTLNVASEGAGKGAVITLSLPRQAHQESQSAHADNRREMGTRAWVLIVEDEPSLVSAYNRIAKALRLNPVVAASLEEVKKAIPSNSDPALVLTDYQLERGSGLDVVAFVRSEFDANVPILVVSGQTDEAVRNELREAGATRFVTKPIGQRDLFAAMQELLMGD